MNKGQKIAVVGLARSGLAAIDLLKRQGHRVRATDSGDGWKLRGRAWWLRLRGVPVEIGLHTQAFLDGHDLVITSPGVPEDSPALIFAETAGIPVIGEIELAYRVCSAPIAAITGSNGKTTVTHWTGALLRASGRRVHVCGNNGFPFARHAAGARSAEAVVLEVSSFQLQRTERFRPKVACILNLSPNHLDRHKDMGSYAQAKWKIFQNQGPDDTLILNRDDEGLRSAAGRARSRVWWTSLKEPVEGAYRLKDELILEAGGGRWPLGRVKELPFFGEHQVQNALFAALTAFAMGADPLRIRGAMGRLKSLPHRLEVVRFHRGVLYVNDSKSTTVDSARAAVRAFKGRILLLAGGRDKGAPFETMRECFSERLRGLILYGEAASRIQTALTGCCSTARVETLEEAVEIAARLAEPGDTVLLSPMCASYDQFSDFEARGRAFRGFVRDLA